MFFQVSSKVTRAFFVKKAFDLVHSAIFQQKTTGKI